MIDQESVKKQFRRLRAFRDNAPDQRYYLSDLAPYNSIVQDLIGSGFDAEEYQIGSRDLKQETYTVNVLSGETKTTDPFLTRDVLFYRVDALLAEIDAFLVGNSAGARDLEFLLSVLNGIGDYIKGLRKGKVLGTTIDSEKSLQALLYPLLLLLFDDVRREDYSSSHAGHNSRIDFVIVELGVALEVKFVRDQAHSKLVGGEILEDLKNYEGHDKCNQFVALIYDPSDCIENPRGFKADLQTSTFGGNSISVILVK